MTLTAGKRDISRLAAVLDAEYATVEEAAKAVLEEAWTIYEEKARWVVFAFPRKPPGRERYASQEDALNHVIVLGPFGTRTQAESVMDSMWANRNGGEEWHRGIVPWLHTSPAEFFKWRSQVTDREEKRRDAERWETRKALWEMRETAFREWLEQNPVQPSSALFGPVKWAEEHVGIPPEEREPIEEWEARVMQGLQAA